MLWLLSDFSIIYACYLCLSSLRLRGVYCAPSLSHYFFFWFLCYTRIQNLGLLIGARYQALVTRKNFSVLSGALKCKFLNLLHSACESAPQSWFIVFQWAVPTLLQELYLFEVFLSSYRLSCGSTQEHWKIGSTCIC